MFIAQKEADGYSAKAVNYPIFTQGNSFEELQANIRDALECHFDVTTEYVIKE
jgi:predicted RNase H-like HicB family nuclease